MDTNVGASAPHPPDGLVTTEGVNEGSQKSTAESAGPSEGTDPPDRLTRGGRPEAAEEQDRESVRHDRAHAVVEPPWDRHDPAAPSLDQSVEEQRARR